MTVKRDESKSIAQEVVEFLHTEKELTYKDARRVTSKAWHILTAEIKKNIKKTD